MILLVSKMVIRLLPSYLASPLKSSKLCWKKILDLTEKT